MGKRVQVDTFTAGRQFGGASRDVWSGGLQSEESSQYYSAMSDIFFDVNSDALYEVTNPMSHVRLLYGVFMAPA
jgi:hypothetical protein